MNEDWCIAKLASGEIPSYVEIPLQRWYEQAVDMEWFIVTPDGIEATKEYEKFDDGSVFT